MISNRPRIGRFHLPLIGMMLMLSAGSGRAAVQSSAGYTMTAHVLCVAGGAASSASHALKSAAGQSSAIGQSSSASYRLSAGFFTTMLHVKVNQSITFNSVPSVVAGSTDILSATATSGLTVTFSSMTPAVCSVGGATVTGIATGTCSIAADQAGDGNYNEASQVTRSFTVTKGAASLSLGSLGAIYDGAAKSVSASTTPAGLSVGITYNGSATPPTRSGSYTVSAVVNDANYTGSASSTLVIAKATQTISFGALAVQMLGNADFDPMATVSSGFAPGYSSSNLEVATVVNGKLHLIGEGVSVITATQSGNSDYGAAPSVSQSLRVEYSPAIPSLTVSTLSDGAVTGETMLNVSGSVSDINGIRSLTINGAAVLLNPDGSFNFPVQLLPGANTITVVVTSKGGNSCADTRIITLESNDLRLTVTYPPDNFITSRQTITVTGTISELLGEDNDADDITARNSAKAASIAPTQVIRYTVNGSDPQFASLSDMTYSFTVNLGSRLNTIRIFATGDDGKTVQVKRTVTYHPAFSLAVTNPATDVHLALGSYLLTGVVTDNTTPVSVTVTTGDQSFTPSVINGVFRQQLRFNEDKTYQISVTAIDQNDNILTVQRNIIHSLPRSAAGPNTPFSIVDALRALQMSAGIASPDVGQLLRMDVAPMLNGISVGDGKIDIEDTIVILFMVVGLLP